MCSAENINLILNYLYLYNNMGIQGLLIFLKKLIKDGHISKGIVYLNKYVLYK